MNINNYFINSVDLSDRRIEELGLDDTAVSYYSVSHSIVEQGKETEITEYFTEDEMQEILELGMYYLKARKEQDEEFDEAELERMAYEDDRAASYGFGSINEMNEYIRELNEKE